MIRRPTHATGRLVCDECVRVSEGRAAGWVALLGREDDDRETVVVMCPTCAGAVGDAAG